MSDRPLSARGRRGLAVLWAGLAGACASFGSLRPAPEAPARRADVSALLVLMPESPSAEAALAGLREELAAEYDLVVRYVGSQVGPEDVAAAVESTAPKAVILMNNPTVRAYRQFQRSSPASARIPVVVLLASFLRETSSGLENFTGVIYEVPLVTSLVNLRDLLVQPVARVGVVHRPSFSAFLGEQQRLAGPEGFALVLVEVSGDGVSELRAAVERLRAVEKVDAIWILNDNALLDRRQVERGWLPALRNNETPILVNVGSLLSRSTSFGTFAVLPDHRGLGVQAAGLVSLLAERGWRATGLGLEYPLAVEKVLDLAFARQKLQIRAPRLATVDRVIE